MKKTLKIINSYRQPLSGVEVYNTKTKQGWVTDFDGFVDIKGDSDDVILIKFLGYKDVKKPLKELPYMLMMEESSEHIGDVVVTVVKKKKKFPWILALLGIGLYAFTNNGAGGMNRPDKTKIVEI